ncbi:MAG TPA: glycosyltransferase [Longimicrobiaceae bacterium]|nr:glycosyltransferase [Longimicrobiaceae bacterium]
MFVVAHNGARIWGGAERATSLLLAGLQARGHRVLLLCNDPRVARRAEEMGIPTEVLELGGDAALHHALRLAARLRRLHPDALIIGTFKKVWLASLGARLAGVRRVVARIGLETDTPRRAKYHLALRRWVDAVVLNAGRLRPAYLALPGMTPERVAVIPNGVFAPERTRSREEVRAELGIPAGARVVGAVARLAVQKRLDRLIEAMALLPGDVHCVLAGDGPQRTALERLAERPGVSRRVHFAGWRSDTGDVLAALDVFVVSSDSEGMSNAMLEAMAAGVPVVSTPVSGVDEALAPLGDGRRPGIVAGFGVGEIAAAVRELLDDAALRQAASAAARERAAERFGVERMLDLWERVLRGESA